MDAFTAHKYRTSQREMDIKKIIYILKNDPNVYKLSEACAKAGVNMYSLTEKEVDLIKKSVG